MLKSTTEIGWSPLRRFKSILLKGLVLSVLFSLSEAGTATPNPNPRKFFGRAMSDFDSDDGLRSFEYAKETLDGIRLGCRGDVDGRKKNVRALFIEDVNGERSLTKLAPTRARFLNSSNMEQEKRILLKEFPHTCLQRIFARGNCPLGNRGLPGNQGARGDPGTVGLPGFPGKPGTPGIDAFPAFDGRPGADGPKGPKGPRGNVGDAVVGPPGQPGLPGRAGPDGPPGDPGLNGAAGSDGKPGNNGSPGLDGQNGLPGDPGDIGPPGIWGVDGGDGQKGVDGQNGANGLDGDCGDTDEPVTEKNVSKQLTPSYNRLI